MPGRLAKNKGTGYDNPMEQHPEGSVQKDRKKRKIGQIFSDWLIGISTPLVVIASAVILGFIFILSFVLPASEKTTILQKTDYVCMSTAIGISSVTIEGISGNKRDIVADYLIQLQAQNIRGLKSARVVEFEQGDHSGTRFIAGGKIIGSLDYREVGESENNALLNEMKGLRSLKKTVETNSDGIFYAYLYPILWRVKLDGNMKTIPLGALEVRFSEREILADYYQYQNIAAGLSLGAAISGVLIVALYLLLVRLLKVKIVEIHTLSVTDALTGIFNRKRFNEVLESEIRRVKRYGGVLSLMMFDIDHFKRVNDSYGHDAGDEVLVTVTSVVKQVVRSTDLLARWGGEEFMVLCPSTGLKETADFAERIRADIEKKQIETVGHVTSSFGVATFGEFDTPETFLKRVDNALYKSKEGGRNRVTVG